MQSASQIPMKRSLLVLILVETSLIIKSGKIIHHLKPAKGLLRILREFCKETLSYRNKIAYTTVLIAGRSTDRARLF